MNTLKQILTKIRAQHSSKQPEESSIALIKLPTYFKDNSKLKHVNESYPIIKTNQNNVDYVVASAHITFNPEINKLHYTVHEPKIRGFDKLINSTVESIKKIKTDNLAHEQKYTYLNKQVSTLWADEELNHTENIKARYYVFRDVLGFGKLEPLLRDTNLSGIYCYNIDSPLCITHINSKYGKMQTNITLTGDEIHELKHKFPSLGKNLKKSGDFSAFENQQIFNILIDARDNKFSIKKSVKHPLTVTDLANYETINPVLLGYLWLAIEEQQSILIAGEKSSGRKTFLSAIASFIHPASKIVTIEDSPEIYIAHPNWTPQMTRKGLGENKYGEISKFDLLKLYAKLHPDYIITSDIDNSEANVLLQAMANGYPSLSTIAAHQDVNELLTNIASGSLAENLSIVISLSDNKVAKITEISNYDKETRKLNTHEVLVSNKSHILAKIAERRGWTEQQAAAEVMKRANVISWMQNNNVHEFRKVVEIIHNYYS